MRYEVIYYNVFDGIFEKLPNLYAFISSTAHRLTITPEVEFFTLYLWNIGEISIYSILLNALAIFGYLFIRNFFNDNKCPSNAY